MFRFLRTKRIRIKQRKYFLFTHVAASNCTAAGDSYTSTYLLEVRFTFAWRWSGGAKVLGKLSVPGRPTSLDDSRARAYCACSRCGWGCLDIFSLIYLFSFLSPSLWETARYRLKYCLKGALNSKQPTNQHHI